MLTLKNLSRGASALLFVTFMAACGGETTSQQETSDTASTEAEDTEVSLGATQTILERVQYDDDLGALYDAVQAAQLEAALEAAGPLTIFAPSDAAFEELPATTLQPLLEDTTRRKELQVLLSNHIVEGYYPADSLTNGMELTTLAGNTITISKVVNTISVADEPVETPDVQATNGVVHVVAGLIVPGNE
ncbi:fasciclin domain-containing protein [Catalinimonas alkaloidigena]|nr:fasciclin domain-containing protein [Catalinimonas alkaloidigena]